MTDSPTDGEMGLTEAALRLGVSYVQAQRMMLIGKLGGRKAGTRWFVRRADVEHVARERARKPEHRVTA